MSATPLRWSADRWHALATLQQRERRALLYGPGLYATLFLSLLVSAVVLRNDLGFAERNGIAVMSSPLIVPFFFSVTLASLYLALTAATTIAREREQGVLETLFYGPVDEAAYVAGKFTAPFLACAVVAAVNLLWCALVAALANLHLSADLLWVAVAATLSGGMIVAFSLLVSTVTRSARAAVITFLVAAAAVATVQIGYGMVSEQVAATKVNRVSPLLFLRDVLDLLNRVVAWLSPFGYLERGIDAIKLGDGLAFAANAALTAAASVFFLWLAVRALNRRGVRA